MKKDAKCFKEVAERCTKFAPKDCDCGCKNATSEDTLVSCKNCQHYEPDEVCELDLYQEILENHNI